MSKRTESLDELQIDALREIGNVGASYACGALSNLVKKEVLIDVTDCYLEPMDKHLARFGQPKDIVATICIDVATAKGSRVLMILPKDIATMLSDLMMGTQNPPGRMITDEDREVLTEMGDVCIREYLAPISKFLKISPMPSAPVVHVQYVGASAAKANSVLGLDAPIRDQDHDQLCRPGQEISRDDHVPPRRGHPGPHIQEVRGRHGIAIGNVQEVRDLNG